MFERLLLLWLTLLSLLAYFWPQWLPGVWDPFVGTSAYQAYVFAVTMLAIGSLLPRDEVRSVLRQWPRVLGGTTIQYVSMPILAYACGRAFGLSGDWLIGIIMVGCVPGAMASNVLTMAAHGNVSYSVSLTTSATILSPVAVPVALWFFLRQWVPVDPIKVGIQLSWMVVLPVVVGHLLSQRWSLWEKIAQKGASVVANLTILWIIATVIAVNREKLAVIDTQMAIVLLALLTVNLLGYLAGALGGLLLRLPSSMRRALTLEIGMQNAGLGTVLAMGLFGEQSAAAIPPAIYTFGCMFTGTVLARLWAELGSKED